VGLQADSDPKGNGEGERDAETAEQSGSDPPQPDAFESVRLDSTVEEGRAPDPRAYLSIAAGRETFFPV